MNSLCILLNLVIFSPQAEIREEKNILFEFSKSNQELILDILYTKDEKILETDYIGT